MRTIKNMKTLIGLTIVISAIVLIVLLSGCVQKPPQKNQTTTTPGELSKEIDEINSTVEDLESLSNSAAELNENEDLLKVFEGD